MTARGGQQGPVEEGSPENVESSAETVRIIQSQKLSADNRPSTTASASRKSSTKEDAWRHLHATCTLCILIATCRDDKKVRPS